MLCEIATRLNARGQKQIFSFPFAVTQFQLADAAGLTSVHVNRVLRSLRQDGLAVAGNREVKILDRDGLARAGEFNANYLQTRIKPDDRIRIIQPV